MIRVPKDGEIDQSNLVIKIKNILNNYSSEIEYRKIDFVGPKIGQQLIKSAILAL